MPNLIKAAAQWLGFTAQSENPPAGIEAQMQARRQTGVSAERALSLTTIYRGIQIHATSVCQTPIYTYLNGLREPANPALIDQPNIDEYGNTAFLEYTTISLYTDGNAFWLIRRGTFGQAVNLEALNPNEVTVIVTRDRAGIDHITFGYRGRTYQPNQIRHLKLLRVPGLHRGLGPIQAAQIDVRGSLDARDYGALWLSDANVPDGLLTTDQVLGPGDADKYKNIWFGREADGTEKPGKTHNRNERLRVLGSGLTYSPILLKPSDVQFLETQQFNNVQLARLIGAPASLMLIGVEGGSQVYANIEQDFIGYIRFSLRKVFTEIETAFNSVLATPGRTHKFDTDVLTRPDTKTRMEGHAIALENGIKTDDEIRADEGLPPLTPEQRALVSTRTPAPTLKVKQ